MVCSTAIVRYCLRMLLQETYEVLDTFKYDKGLSGTGEHTDIWTGHTTLLTRYTNYSELLEADTDNRYIRTEIPTGINVIIEFYAQANHSSNNAFRFYQDNINVGYFSMSDFADNINDLYHCRISLNSDGTATITSNDSSKTKSLTLSLDGENPLLFEFNTRQNVTSVKFKEFKVYSA